LSEVTGTFFRWGWQIFWGGRRLFPMDWGRGGKKFRTLHDLISEILDF